MKNIVILNRLGSIATIKLFQKKLQKEQKKNLNFNKPTYIFIH